MKLKKYAVTTHADRAWAAGLFEGEGSIIPSKQGANHWTLAVTMTDLDVIRRFHQVVGFGKIYGPYHYSDGLTRKRKHHKKFWRWSVSDRDGILAVALKIQPWLCKRRSSKLQKAVKQVSLLVARPNMIRLKVLKRIV